MQLKTKININLYINMSHNHVSIKTILALLLVFCLGAVSAAGRKEHHTFALGKGHFLLDGRPFVVKAGELHYPRIPEAYWRHRLRMVKSLGMNAVCVYVFWNYHEERPGEFNFKGQRDVARFCRMAAEEGLYVILRPGPYACAEWEMGGLPWWLLKKKDIEVRTSDPYFLERTEIYLKALGRELADLQISRGGNIIMVQVENEYGAYAEDKVYMSRIRDMVREAGFTDVPLFQCDWSSTFQRNGLDDLLWTLNFGTGADIDAQFAPLRKVRPESPLMCSEFWSGWFDHWGRRHETRDAKQMVAGLRDMLDRGISFSLYMVHGGTTFGHWGGANAPTYSAMCSSYDYDAPISEAGWATPKYHELREMLMQYLDSGQVAPPVPEPIPVISVPAFALTEVAPLFDNLPRPVHSDSVKPMEQFDQGWGTILYRMQLPAVAEGTVLLIDDVHDWAQVYAGGKLLGRLDRRRGENTLRLPQLPAGTQLDILVEAMGRVNFDRTIHDRKGITNAVCLLTDGNRQELTGWDVYSFPPEADFAADKDFHPGAAQEAPAYYRATFSLDRVGDTFLDLRSWGKGMVWVNGHALGRFWRIGPQQTLYLPGCWLKKGKNEIVILDLLGPKKAEVAGLERPILDELHAEAPLTHRAKGETLRLDGATANFSGTLPAGGGWKELKFGTPVTGRYVCIEALNAQDGGKTAAIAELYLLGPDGKPLPRQDWLIKYADSESTSWGNYTAEKVYDLQESTYWSTADGSDFPHAVVIDLGATQTVTGLRVLPRMEHEAPAAVKDVKVYVSPEPFPLK